MVNENEVITIKLDDIIPNRFQPREVFDDQSMQELAESIKEHGVIQPIIVRPVDNKYEIIAGERRYKASVMAGKTDIPAIVKVKDDKESSIIAFIENSQRKDVSPIEEARTCERILSTNDITQEQLAKQLGMSQSTLANKLRLLTLPVEVQDALLHGEISERHARSIISIKDTRKQLDLLDKIKNEKLTVRELDGVIKNMLEEANKDGLYNLPGSDEYNENLDKTVPMDFSKYENKVEEPKAEVPAPVAPATPEAPKSDNQFLDFLNTIDDSNITPEGEDVTATVDVPAVEEPVKEDSPAESNEFLSFLNNVSDAKLEPESTETGDEGTEGGTTVAPLQVEETPSTEAPKEEPAPNDFLSFLNTIDDNKISAPEVPTEEPAAPAVEAPAATPEAPSETPAATLEDKNFDDFLNSFNSGITPTAEPAPVEETPVVETPSVPTEPVVQEATSAFDDFLKKYEEPSAAPAVEEPKVDTPVVETPVVPEVPETPASPVDPKIAEASSAFDEFLKKYEAPVDTPVDLGPVEELVKEAPPVTVEEPKEEAPADPNSKYLNPIQDVVEKPKYVENEPNYVDITKPISYDSVDSIIGELKVVTDKIKKSKYKITTEETNYDDVYTITIKIDKRNFL